MPGCDHAFFDHASGKKILHRQFALDAEADPLRFGSTTIPDGNLATELQKPRRALQYRVKLKFILLSQKRRGQVRNITRIFRRDRLACKRVG